MGKQRESFEGFPLSWNNRGKEKTPMSEVIFMPKSDRLTWEQIKTKYPNQWVRLENVEWKPENDATVNSAIVAKAGDVSTQDRCDAVKGKCFVIYVDDGNCFHTGVVTAV